MSERTKSPLLNIAASLVATVKCCSNNVETATTTTISGNNENSLEGNAAQAVAPLVKSASSMSTEITPIVEEPPAQPQA